MFSLLPTNANRIPSVSTALVLAIIVAISGCGDQTIHSGDSSEPDKPTRYENLQPLDLEPGEAKEGIHLLPGIEVIELYDLSRDHDDVVLDPDASTLTLYGDAKQLLHDNAEELWVDDVLIADDFIFLLDDVIDFNENSVTLGVAPFELLRVVHGEWETEDVFDPLANNEDLLKSHYSPFGLLYMNAMTDPGMLAALSGEGGHDIDINILEFFGIDNDFHLDINIDINGSFAVPVDFHSEFRGRIVYNSFWHPDISINEQYECETYTEQYYEKSGWRFWEDGQLKERTVQPDENFCLDYFTFYTTFGVESSVDGQFSVTAGAGAKDETKNRREISVGIIPLGAGLSLVPQAFLEGSVEWDFSGEASISGSASGSVEIPVGFEIVRQENSSERELKRIPNSDNPVQTAGAVEHPSLDLAVALSTKILLDLGIRITVTDSLTGSKGLSIRGPEAGLGYGWEMEAKPIQTSSDGSYDPCLTAEEYIRIFGRGTFEAKADFGWLEWGIHLGSFGEVEHKWHIMEPFESQGDDFCLFTQEQDSLEFRLSWDEPNLIDLYVETPEGDTIWYQNASINGGMYDSISFGDSCVSDDSTCVVTTDWHSIDPENIPSGEYKVWAQNTQSDQVVNYTLEAIVGGSVTNTWQGTLPTSNEPIQTYSLDFNAQSSD